MYTMSPPVANEMMRVRCEGAGEESVDEAELTFTAFELVTENVNQSETAL